MKINRSFKWNQLIIIFGLMFLTVSFSSNVYSQESLFQTIELTNNKFELTLKVSNDQLSINVVKNNISWSCKPKPISGSSPKISTFQLNYEESALILTDIDYVLIEDLLKCKDTGYLNVSHIPREAGFLVDINLKHGIFIGIDAVSARPSTYAAIVAKLDSNRLLVDLPGAYSPRKSIKALQKNAFTYNETEPARISLDGRYVSVSGSPNCGGQPGVWDLKKRKPVTFPHASDAERQNQCEALFTK
jgi:hypothetical protein